MSAPLIQCSPLQNVLLVSSDQMIGVVPLISMNRQLEFSPQINNNFVPRMTRNSQVEEPHLSNFRNRLIECKSSNHEVNLPDNEQATQYQPDNF